MDEVERLTKAIQVAHDQSEWYKQENIKIDVQVKERALNIASESDKEDKRLKELAE